MDKEMFAELLDDFCCDYGYTLADDYSGRCMFGRTCYGVIGDRNEMAIDLVCFLYDNDAQEFVSLVKNANWDSMGLDSIMYFPSVKGVQYEEEEEG